MQQLTFSDLSAQAIMRNPIAFYGRRREQEPLSRLTTSGVSGWIITTSYAESIALLKDPRLVRDRRNALAQNAPQPSFGGPLALFSQNMMFADPHQFSDPETLAITRTINQHPAFGKGIHTCLGAPLAHLEGQIAIGRLLQRLPDLHLACETEQVSWNPIPYMHSLRELPITFEGR